MVSLLDVLEALTFSQRATLAISPDNAVEA